jgi:ABC-2 type transport system permease protein
MPRAETSALLAFVALGWRRAAADRAGSLGRLAFYWLLLMIFWALWQATPLHELRQPGINAARLFWYMTVTECVLIAVGFPYRAVERDILSGEIAAALLRPLPYAAAILAEWIGATFHRLALLAAGGLVAGIWATGTVEIPLAVVPALLLSTAIATILVLLCQLQLGYAAAWTGSAAPLFWIWQKMIFILGGVMIPLSLYPEPYGSLAAASPFAAMFFAPASFLLDGSPRAIFATLALQVLWLAVIAMATLLIARAAAARFAVHGI